MAASFILSPEALDDIDQSMAWYEQRQQGLGAEFLKCVEETLQRILEFPESQELLWKSYRRTPLHRFPYSLYFRDDVRLIRVYGVIHQSRNSRVWRSRLE